MKRIYWLMALASPGTKLPSGTALNKGSGMTVAHSLSVHSCASLVPLGNWLYFLIIVKFSPCSSQNSHHQPHAYIFTALDSKENTGNMENSRKVLNCWKSLDSSNHLGVGGRRGTINHEMLTRSCHYIPSTPPKSLLEKTLESPLDCKEIKLVHSKGNQPWIFTGRTDAETETPILWSPDGKNWLTGKNRGDEKDWRQEEKGTTEDEMVGWHHRLNGHEFEQAPGVGDGQGSLACCSPWGRKESGTHRGLCSHPGELVCL